MVSTEGYFDTLTRPCTNNRFAIFDLLPETLQYLLAICRWTHGVEVFGRIKRILLSEY